MNSLDTRFSGNVFEAVQKTRSICYHSAAPRGFKSRKNTAARVLNTTYNIHTGFTIVKHDMTQRNVT